MSLARWDPFSEVASLRQVMDRLFDESFIRSGGPSLVGDAVPLDLIEQEDAVVVKASLPGVKPEDVNVAVRGMILTIDGATGGEEEQGNGAGRYHRRERWYGRFSRQISLPTEVSADACDATFEDGVLTVTLPKAEGARPKRIGIRAGDRPAVEGGKPSHAEDAEAKGREDRSTARAE